MKVLLRIEVPESEYATDAWFEAIEALPAAIHGRVVGVYHDTEAPQ